MLLAVDGLSPTVRAAFERAANLDNYSRGELRDTDQWVMLIADDKSSNDLVAELDTQPGHVHGTLALDNAFIVDTFSIVPPDPFSVGTGGQPLPPRPEDVVAKLQNIDFIEYFYPLVSTAQTAKLIPNDEFFFDQWHLRNTGQSGGTPGADTNVVDVWDDYTGQGVVIAIVDDGVEMDHPDLVDNLRPDLSFDFNNNDNDPTPGTQFDDHGTAVAGVAAAQGNNTTGVAGVAFEAGIAGIRLLGGRTDDALEADALSHETNEIDIFNNSWGPFDAGVVTGAGPLALSAIEQGAVGGRGGLGNVYTWAGGNGRENDDNVNYDGYANSRFTIAVGAIDHNGTQSYYSEPGAALLVVAPSDNETIGVTTTDLTGADGSDPTDYRNDFGGTSSATPVVSGVVALMLEANPSLTYRDIQHILVNSASVTDARDADWALNGAGHDVNHNYGFGAIDAEAAVDLALLWNPVDGEERLDFEDIIVDSQIVDDEATGVTSSVIVNDELSVEWVEVLVNIDHSVRGDLEVILTSPSGTESILAEPHGKQDVGSYESWVFTTNRNWDESSLGEWTITVRDLATGANGTFDSWSLFIYGTDPDPPSVGATGNVVGVKWLDDNGNGVQEEIEPGLADWRIYADLNNNGVLNVGEPSTLSGPSGNYVLSGVPVGTHAIREQLRVGWVQTFPSQDDFQTVTVAANVSVPNINFGNRPRPSEITGVKWNDLDQDGLRDVDEPGVSGVTIYLDLNENGSLDVGEPFTQTRNDGTYSLTELEPAEYVVAEVNLDGVEQTFPTGSGTHRVTVAERQVVDDVDFGNVLGSGSVFGSTWVDLDGNGLRTVGETPLSGLLVYVDENGDGLIGFGEPVTATDANGNYRLRDLGSGDFDVRVVVPPGHTQMVPVNRGGYELEFVTGSAAVNVNFGFGLLRDLGDAPAPYPTTLAANGPIHPITTDFYLGAGVDTDLDGVPSLGADGDDADGSDDEDGVVFSGDLVAGRSVGAEVTVSGQGYLQGWIDFNGDGDWVDVGEQVFNDVLLRPGTTRLTVPVPSNAVDGNTYARFRFSHESGLGFTGPAFDGEVEDYRLTVDNDTHVATPAEANNDLFTVDAGSNNNVLAILANDAAGGIGLTVDAVGTPSRGGSAVLATNNRSILYTPADGFVGTEVFVYSVRNTLGDTDQATVTINVRGSVDSLSAVNDTATVDQNSSANLIDVIGNDILPPGANPSVISTSTPNAGGTVTIGSDDRSLVYTPAPGFVGAESFTYTVADGLGQVDSATVTVRVDPVTLVNAGDDLFMVEAGSQNNLLNVLGNDIADDAATLSIIAVATPSRGGIATISNDGTGIVYSPPANFLGNETFTYTVSDGQGGSDQALVTITVQQPTSVTASDDTFSIATDSTNNQLDVISNDTMVGGGTLIITSVSTPNQGGSASISQGGTRIQYAPAAGYVGDEVFEYTVSNGLGTSDTAIVTIHVGEVIDSQVLIRLTTTTLSGETLTSVNVGDSYLLRGYVQDLRDNPTGVFGAFLDVNYDSALTTVDGSIDHGPTYTNGVGGSTTTVGLIDEVGGLSSSTSGSGDEALLFSLPFTADAAGTVVFLPNAADIRPLHDVLLFDRGTPLSEDEIDFRSTSLQINSFTNARNALDVNGDTFVSGIDALLVINELNARGARSVRGTMPGGTTPIGFVDVNGDGFVSGIDALLIINALNEPETLPQPSAAGLPASSVDSAWADYDSFGDSDHDDEQDDADDLFDIV